MHTYDWPVGWCWLCSGCVVDRCPTEPTNLGLLYEIIAHWPNLDKERDGRTGIIHTLVGINQVLKTARVDDTFLGSNL